MTNLDNKADTRSQRDVKALCAAVARLEGERDAARAALATLTADVERLAQTLHQVHHGGERAAWRACSRGLCEDIRRAVARVRVAAEHGG